MGAARRWLVFWFAWLPVLASGAEAAPPGERATLQLKWRHQFQFAGYYAALEQGYYRQAGLDVEIREARPDTDPVREVTEGRADFGVGTTDLLLARHRGQPMVVLAVIFQHSPLVLIAGQSDKVRNLQDLAGKRVMLVPHETELYAYLKQEGLPAGSYTELAHSFDYLDLLRGKVDAMSGYSTDEPYELRQAGMNMLIFSPRASGIDFYGDNLFTSQSQITRHPERVRAFREASLRGWQYAMDHPEEISDLILAKYSKRHVRAHLLFEAGEMRHLMQPDLIQIGHMNPGRWRHIADTYAEMGMLPRNFPLDGLMYEPGAKAYPGWTYWGAAGGIAAAAVLSLLAAYMLRLNRRLRRQMAELRAADRRLSQSEHRYRLLASNTSDVIWTMDMTGRFTYISPSVEKLRGYSVDEAMGQTLEEAFTPASAAVARGAMLHLFQHGQLQRERWEMEQPRKDGSTVWTEVTVNVVREDGGHPIGLQGVTRDIGEQKRIRDALQARSVAIEAAAEAVLIADRDGYIEYVNPAFTRNTGYPAEEAVGRRPSILKSGMQDNAFYQRLWQTILAGQVWKGEVVNRRKDGILYTEEMAISPVKDESGTVVRFVAIKRDISERKKMEENLSYMAHYDRLTALPNRTLFFERLERALSQARRHQGALALLFIDLDGFKAVNDTYGHGAGDQVLVETANRIREVVRPYDLMGRVGGEEFLLVMPKCGPLAASQLAERLRRTIEEHPFSRPAGPFHVTVSIGVTTWFGTASTSPRMLVEVADEALYRAKRGGRNRVEVGPPRIESRPETLAG